MSLGKTATAGVLVAAYRNGDDNTVVAMGTSQASGAYTITATSSDGTTNTTLTPYIASKVTSVTLDSSTQALDVTTENGTVPLSSIVSIL